MSQARIIQPRTLKGFRDYLPAAMLARERLIDTARAVYRSFGFSPIDTPALEYTEILLGKGGAETDKQLFRFEDQGGRDVTMRFDLTVPLARFTAQHVGTLGTPFKRYAIGTVWRGENTARGRYREFVQCDYDTIGTESVLADAETVLVAHELFARLGLGCELLVNNRRALDGVLEGLDLVERAAPVLRSLDKLDKIGPDKVAEEMQREAGVSETQAREVLAIRELTGSADQILDALDAKIAAGSEVGQRGLQELQRVFACLRSAGVDTAAREDAAGSFATLDLSIARGLDYYTGTVFETKLLELPSIGSVCSGGRYDDLASLYTKERLPGVGAALGLDRLLAALEELDMVEARATPARVFVALFDAEREADYLVLASRLRAAGIETEVYPEARKLGAQLKYADRRGHKVAVVVGGQEWEDGTAQLKDLASGEKRDVAQSELVEALRGMLG